jgi:four helix bundle protein
MVIAGNASKGGFRDLKVYRLAYATAMDIFRRSRSFPGEERYSLTSQIRRSSRSVAANIAEGYRKRQYPAMFSSKLADADAEATETVVWLDFAHDCGYLVPEVHRQLAAAYDELGRMLHVMINNPAKFAPR